MKHRFALVAALTIAGVGFTPAIVSAQSSTRAPVTDLSTPRAGQQPIQAQAQTAPRAGTPAPAAESALRKQLADLTLELEQLRAELRELRGQLEVQTHEFESLKNRNREALADTDKRLRELERKAAPAAAGPDAAPTTALPSAGEQQEYDAAFNLMKQGNYDRAAKAFREFVARHPDSDLAANAQYWIGEALYVVRNFKQALPEFTKVVEKYPSNLKVADALLKIGYSHHELGALDKARAALQQVISRYPNTASAKAAERRLTDVKAAEARAAESKAKGATESKPKKP
jgi:tol-pal system protein YbgF